ncbi:hypothetical protein P8452_14130 [Trifolium repens]|nr:hypothetical protein P8452_14130 [Trifolium repens]
MKLQMEELKKILVILIKKKGTYEWPWSCSQDDSYPDIYINTIEVNFVSTLVRGDEEFVHGKVLFSYVVLSWNSR